MRRLRRLFRLLSAASLLIAIAVIAAWVHSERPAPPFRTRNLSPNGGDAGPTIGMRQFAGASLDPGRVGIRIVRPWPPTITPEGRTMFTFAPGSTFGDQPDVPVPSGVPWGAVVGSMPAYRLIDHAYPFPGVSVERETVFTARATRRVEVGATYFISLWLPLLLASVLPAGWAIDATRRAVARRRRVGAGRCPACGYDLRATPDRCPECGTTPAA